jgi:hypothetical protein
MCCCPRYCTPRHARRFEPEVTTVATHSHGGQQGRLTHCHKTMGTQQSVSQPSDHPGGLRLNQTLAVVSTQKIEACRKPLKDVSGRRVSECCERIA